MFFLSLRPMFKTTFSHCFHWSHSIERYAKDSAEQRVQMDADENDIYFLVSVWGRAICHQIMLDDTEDADVLIHLLPSIHFI